MVSTQLLSELEEIIQCVAIPEKKQVLQQSWWDRLLVSYTCVPIIQHNLGLYM